MTNDFGKTVEIFLAEDNEADIHLFRESLKEWKTPFNFVTAQDGDEALKILQNEDYLPDLIFLDINMPKKSGLEVLDVIKQNPDLQCIPAIVISGSAAQQDVMSAYKLQANSFVQKPQDFDDFLALARAIEGWWLQFTLLPKRRKTTMTQETA